MVYKYFWLVCFYPLIVLTIPCCKFRVIAMNVLNNYVGERLHACSVPRIHTVALLRSWESKIQFQVLSTDQRWSYIFWVLEIRTSKLLHSDIKAHLHSRAAIFLQPFSSVYCDPGITKMSKGA